jgi:hypothetical protein
LYLTFFSLKKAEGNRAIEREEQREEREMKIFVKTLKGTSFEIEANPEDKVSSYFP